jgi:hypothetical protein
MVWVRATSNVAPSPPEASAKDELQAKLGDSMSISRKNDRGEAVASGGCRPAVATAVSRPPLAVGPFFFACVATIGFAFAQSPIPRTEFVGEQLRRWDFDGDSLDWTANGQCELALKEGGLTVTSTGGDPYFVTPARVPGGAYIVRLRMRSRMAGIAQFFWTSTNRPDFSADKSVVLRVTHDGQWHEYQTRIKADGDLLALRFDPGLSKGTADIDWLAIHRGGLHPLQIANVKQHAGRVAMTVHNHGEQKRSATINGQRVDIDADGQVAVELPMPKPAGVAPMKIEVASQGLPPIKRIVWAYRRDVELASIEHEIAETTVQAARDGTEIRLLRGGQAVAALAPLVHESYRLPKLKLKNEAWPLVFEGDGVSVEVSATPEGNPRISITADRPVEGPIVRVFGGLEQGLLAGVEYLGKNERSSSKLDIETDEYYRFEPDPMHLTMPLMAAVTDRGSLAMLWEDPSLQPTFAAPDFIDGLPGQRMSLKGKTIAAEFRLDDGWPLGGRLESAIHWAVKKRGLPTLPDPPRSFAEQMKLNLQGFNGVIRDEKVGGWYHAVVPGVRTLPDRAKPLADCVSAIWRITGEVPQTASLAYGGSHIRDPASYFLTGRARQWLDTVDGQARHKIGQQRSDGSFRYDGKFRRGHFENTASGVCARPAFELLRHAKYTGDEKSLTAGLKAVSFLRRFRTPRGAQVWEVPLHTPDILASAYAVWANTLAFELTGDREYSNEARHWAITGLPFVYQWSNQPIMAYATTPVLGATNWRAPNWIGLPVQWCGLVYARAIWDFAEYDDTLDWRKVAAGITICGERMQYPNGPSIGTLPDVFQLPEQLRRPADINPGALVTMRRRLNGLPAGIHVAGDGKHRVVSPYPVTIRDGVATIEAKSGKGYQIAIDGSRIVTIESRGEDTMDLNKY